MRELAEGLWVEDRRFRVAGLEVGTRMTVVRLEDESLFLHSPVALDAELRAELEAIGPIRHVVAPNLHHHVYLADYRELPQVQIYASPGLSSKRKDIHFDACLTDEPPEAWRGQIDQHCFQGAPWKQCWSIWPRQVLGGSSVRLASKRMSLRFDERPGEA